TVEREMYRPVLPAHRKTSKEKSLPFRLPLEPEETYGQFVRLDISLPNSTFPFAVYQAWQVEHRSWKCRVDIELDARCFSRSDKTRLKLRPIISPPAERRDTIRISLLKNRYILGLRNPMPLHRSLSDKPRTLPLPRHIPDTLTHLTELLHQLREKLALPRVVLVDVGIRDFLEVRSKVFPLGDLLPEVRCPDIPCLNRLDETGLKERAHIVNHNPRRVMPTLGILTEIPPNLELFPREPIQLIVPVIHREPATDLTLPLDPMNQFIELAPREIFENLGYVVVEKVSDVDIVW